MPGRRLGRKLSWVILSILCIQQAAAQDFSNKGKDFWVGYGYHVRFFSGNPQNVQEMVLYISTEAVTNVTVSIPGLGYTKTYSNIPANTVFTTDPMPKTLSMDARLVSEGTSDKGIHITSNEPVVAYAHIYDKSVSGATLLFPTNTLGEEYYSINFDQKSNSEGSYPFFYAIATDTGTTTIEVTPSANTEHMDAGKTYSFDLTQGQVFNALGKITGKDGVDLTGSKIRSVSHSGSGCKRIAVFSGSAKIYINCGSSQGKSADNYMVQAFPQTAWGKYYLTVPTANLPYNFFRIAVSAPTTVVKMNGNILTGLIGNFYYQTTTSEPAVIEADKPITVAQYITTQNTCTNGSPGDPEVIYLSPVEQNIDKVILNSTANYDITEHFINVVIPNGGTGVSSFKIDGAAPVTSFIPDPQNNQYSYIQIPVGAGQHTIQSDSGFNAIAYGYGKYESYGYNAGTNVKDLYQFISVHNKYATVDFPAGCKGTPLYFYMTLPYQPLELSWKFSGLFADTVINHPTYDSTWIVNGRTLYQYKLNKQYAFQTAGTFPILVVAKNPTANGCAGIQNISFDLKIFDPPKVAFAVTHDSCVSDSVHFMDTTSTADRKILKWYWDFGDGVSDSVKSPLHKYATGGTYSSRLSVISDIGCISDTATHIIDLGNIPTAKFDFSSLDCEGKDITISDSSAVAGTTNIKKWKWDFGDNSQVERDNNKPFFHNYSHAGNYKVDLVVETNKGCAGSAYSRNIIVHDKPKAGFISPVACLEDASAAFKDTSHLAAGNITSWQWDFGEPATGNTNPNNSTQQNPTHQYFNPGSFTTQLIVTTDSGCTDTTRQTFTIKGSIPHAKFGISDPQCEGKNISFSDSSKVVGATTITKWNWDFGDDTQTVLNTNSPFTHTYSTAGTYKLSLVAETDKGCISDAFTRDVIVNDQPEAGFISPEVCLADASAPFRDTTSLATGNIASWHWNFGDPAANNTNPNISTLQNPFHRYSSSGAYNTRLIVTTNSGCIDSVSHSFTVNGSVPQADFSIIQANKLCSNLPVSITNISTVDFGNIVKLEIYWDYANDPSLVTLDEVPSSGKTYSHTYPVFYTPATKTYEIKMVAYSGISCFHEINKIITLSATPKLAFSPIPPVCAEVPPFNITEASITNGLAGSSIFSGNGITPTGLFNPAMANTGSLLLTYTYQASNGCIDSISQSVIVYPTPLANAGPDMVLLEGGSITLAPILSDTIPVSYLWSPATALSNPSIPTPQASPTDSITYTLKLTSDKGCSSSDPVFVKVLKKPEIPNAFSPNGDGINDLWEIKYLNTYPGATVEIFNRYGQIMFHSQGYTKPWDGRYNGKNVPTGTYYYIINPKNGREKIAGFVDILR